MRAPSQQCLLGNQGQDWFKAGGTWHLVEKGDGVDVVVLPEPADSKAVAKAWIELRQYHDKQGLRRKEINEQGAAVCRRFSQCCENRSWSHPGW